MDASRQNQRQKGLGALYLLCLGLLFSLLLTGCMAGDAAQADYGAPGDWPGEPGASGDYLAEAEQALNNHNVRRARDFYEDGLLANPRDGRAAVGKGFTNLLLLPGFSEVAALLIEDLGARHGLDANDVIYGRDGYLYWLSRGATWDDQGQFEGIRSILSNRLPWPREKLNDLAIFADGLTRPVDGLMENAIGIVYAIEEIEQTLEIALEDPYFTRLYIPGQTFHEEQLAIILGRSEVAALQSALAMIRGGLLFIAAYRHDWTLEGAFGTWRQSITAEDERFVEGYGPRDYTAAYLDAHLFREVVHVQRLIESRAAFARGLGKARQSIELGMEQTLVTTFQWQLVEVEQGRDLKRLIDAVTGALEGPSAVPFTQPATTLDLSSFFEVGRVLDDETPWLLRSEDQDGLVTWQLNDEALQRFLINGVFSPTFDPAEGAPVVDITGKNPLELTHPLISDYLDRVQDTFLTAR